MSSFSAVAFAQLKVNCQKETTHFHLKCTLETCLLIKQQKYRFLKFVQVKFPFICSLFLFEGVLDRCCRNKYSPSYLLFLNLQKGWHDSFFEQEVNNKKLYSFDTTPIQKAFDLETESIYLTIHMMNYAYNMRRLIFSPPLLISAKYSFIFLAWQQV